MLIIKLIFFSVTSTHWIFISAAGSHRNSSQLYDVGEDVTYFNDTRDFTESAWTHFQRGNITLQRTVMDLSEGNVSAILRHSVMTVDKVREEENLKPMTHDLLDKDLMEWNDFEDKSDDWYLYTLPNISRTSYAVALLAPGIFCSGTLVTPSLVLTASHCLENIEVSENHPVSILAGGTSVTELTSDNLSPGAQVRLGTYKITRPKILENFKINDIALLKTNKPFDMTKTVNIYKLSEQKWPYKDQEVFCKYTGFGVVHGNGLSHKDDFKRKTVIIYGQACKDCGLGKDSFHTEKMICSRIYKVHRGDFGAGLICADPPNPITSPLMGVAVDTLYVKDLDNCDLTRTPENQTTKRNTISMFAPTNEYYNNLFLDPYLGLLKVSSVNSCPVRKANLLIVFAIPFIIITFMSKYF